MIELYMSRDIHVGMSDVGMIDNVLGLLIM